MTKQEKIKQTKAENNLKLYEFDDFIVTQDTRQYILTKKSDKAFYRYFTSEIGPISFIRETLYSKEPLKHNNELDSYIKRLEELTKNFEEKVIHTLSQK